ncbi:MAG: plastocyanin/azurin family copper-binding protein, partial [Pseudomonadota bacterium]
LGAASAQHMYRFEPAILMLEPGEAVAFLNSMGDHTVQSQKGLWPEGIAPVDIQGRARSEVTFDTEGLYGVTCARHGRYGMTMLIAVGQAGLDQAAALDVTEIPASAMARDAYAALRDRLLQPGN